MPRIPSRGRSRVSENVRVFKETPGAAGAEGRALSRLGKVGSALFSDLARKRKSAADTKFVSDTMTADSIGFAEEFERIKQDAPEDGSGVGDAAKKFLEERRDAQIKEAPSKEAADRYSNRFNNLLNSGVINAQGFENDLFSKSARKSLFDNAKTIGISHVQNPDPKRLLRELKDYNEEYEEGVGINVDVSEAPKLKKDLNNLMVTNFYNGLSLNESSFSMAKKLLEDKGEGAEINKSLEPEQLARLKAAFKSKIETKNRIRKSTITEQVRSHNYSRLIGSPEATRLGSEEMKIKLRQIETDPIALEREILKIDKTDIAACIF